MREAGCTECHISFQFRVDFVTALRTEGATAGRRRVARLRLPLGRLCHRWLANSIIYQNIEMSVQSERRWTLKPLPRDRDRCREGKRKHLWEKVLLRFSWCWHNGSSRQWWQRLSLFSGYYIPFCPSLIFNPHCLILQSIRAIKYNCIKPQNNYETNKQFDKKKKKKKKKNCISPQWSCSWLWKSYSSSWMSVGHGQSSPILKVSSMLI